MLKIRLYSRSLFLPGLWLPSKILYHTPIQQPTPISVTHNEQNINEILLKPIEYCRNCSFLIQKSTKTYICTRDNQKKTLKTEACQTGFKRK